MAEHHFNIDSTQFNPTIEDSLATKGSVEFDACNRIVRCLKRNSSMILRLNGPLEPKCAMRKAGETGFFFWLEAGETIFFFWLELE